VLVAFAPCRESLLESEAGLSLGIDGFLLERNQ